MNTRQYNVGYLCSTAHTQSGNGDAVALRVVHIDGTSHTYSYRDLDTHSNRVANCLSGLGFARQDVVFTLLGKSFEQSSCLLAALKLELITGTLYTNFGEQALLDRLSDSHVKGIFTQTRHLSKLQALLPKLPSLKYVLLTDLPQHLSDRILSLDLLLRDSSPDYHTPITPAHTPSLLHYTSGSTGKPKGVLHKHNSIILQTLTSREVLQLNPDEIFWCTADPGWVTGVSYGIIGPMSLGVTQIYYEGGYSPHQWLALLINEKVTIWYTAPTALRMLMQEPNTIFSGKSFPDLKYIFSVGEPLNPHVASWATSHFDTPVFDTYFQTETGSIMIANTPLLTVKPGSMGTPIQHISAEVLDDQGKALPPGTVGHLCIKAGWDSMFIAYLNFTDLYQGRFLNGYYFTGDKAYKDPDGYFWFCGRNDDIINTAGHLVSPFEIESALLEIPEVSDAAVTAAHDDLLFEKVIAFIRLRNSVVYDPSLALKIQLHVSRTVSPVAVPVDIIIRDSIPKNKSGKIMRRYLRAAYEGRDPGDISTLDE